MARVRYSGESIHRSDEMRKKYGTSKGWAAGGRVNYPDMTAGAGSGSGRLEKVEQYGDKANPDNRGRRA